MPIDGHPIGSQIRVGRRDSWRLRKEMFIQQGPGSSASTHLERLQAILTWTVTGCRPGVETSDDRISPRRSSPRSVPVLSSRRHQ
jgi:hypothetical protein